MVRKYCNPNKMNCLDKKTKNKKTYLKTIAEMRFVRSKKNSVDLAL